MIPRGDARRAPTSLRYSERCVLGGRIEKEQAKRYVIPRLFSPGACLDGIDRRSERVMVRIVGKIGAALYVCWGLLHFTAAFGVYKLAQTSADTMIQGRLLQTAFHLAAFAAAAIAFAVTLNWRNDRLGFWANGAMVGLADIPFILFLLIPGHVPWWPGSLGPIFWVAAFFFTALGRLGSNHMLTLASDIAIAPKT
jgi:hypothetical protein